MKWQLGVSSLLYLKYEISIVKPGAVQHSLKEQIIHMAMFWKSWTTITHYQLLWLCGLTTIGTPQKCFYDALCWYSPCGRDTVCEHSRKNSGNRAPVRSPPASHKSSVRMSESRSSVLWTPPEKGQSYRLASHAAKILWGLLRQWLTHVLTVHPQKDRSIPLQVLAVFWLHHDTCSSCSQLGWL